MLKKLILTLAVMSFCVFSNVYAHDTEPCPMCRIFNSEVVKESKEELLKIKESIENHLTKENLDKMSDKAIESVQDCLKKVNEKLQTIK